VGALLELRELYADHNGIEDMAPLSPLAALHTLELSNNQLQAVACARLGALEELWLNNNAIAAPEQLAELASLPRLQTLYLAGSPISQLPDYARTVLGLAPQTLRQLDADAVSVHRQRQEQGQSEHQGQAEGAASAGPGGERTETDVE
jgi:Leucine-rich repeat (LRR) protein